MIAGSDAVYSNDFKVQNLIQFSEEISFKQQIVYMKVLLMYLTMLPTEVIILKKLPINSQKNALKLFFRNRKFWWFCENQKKKKIAK